MVGIRREFFTLSLRFVVKIKTSLDHFHTVSYCTMRVPERESYPVFKRIHLSPPASKISGNGSAVYPL